MFIILSMKQKYQHIQPKVREQPYIVVDSIYGISRTFTRLYFTQHKINITHNLTLNVPFLMTPSPRIVLQECLPERCREEYALNMFVAARSLFAEHDHVLNFLQISHFKHSIRLVQDDCVEIAQIFERVGLFKMVDQSAWRA